MSARYQKKMRRMANKQNRRVVIDINHRIKDARRAQIRRALIGAIIIGMFAFAISKVIG